MSERWDRPRDPKRIDVVLDEVRQFWAVHPDWRLGQVIVNAARRAGVDPFQMEDDRLREVLRDRRHGDASGQ